MAPARGIHLSPGELARTGAERRENLANAASMARLLGEGYLCGRTVEQAADDEWNLKVQRLALEVLYVHKAPLPDYVAAG